MTIDEELLRTFPDAYRVLILDNEVTVDAFVTDPPLPWVRLTAETGSYRVGEAYPAPLTKEQADAEEMNWDKVPLDLLAQTLGSAAGAVDLYAFGNNAAQGFPLATALPKALAVERGVIIFGKSLPEQPHYEAAGFTIFSARDALLSMIREKASAAGKEPVLAFINTIEHNDENYHHPWPG